MLNAMVIVTIECIGLHLCLKLGWVIRNMSNVLSLRVGKYPKE